MSEESSASSGRQADAVVGIGVATGGLAALTTVVRSLSGGLGAAYVLVYHPADQADDALVSLLRPATSLPIVVAGDGELVRSDAIYLAPSHREIEIVDRTLRLHAPVENNGGSYPIDRFFRSLARAAGRDAVGVVLAGDVVDGASGLRRLKELGGLTVVQDPDDCERDTLPRAALANGLVDLVVPADQIGPRIRAVLASGDTQAMLLDDGRRSTEIVADALRDILALVRVRSGHDFAQYKRATLLRRIARRMQVCQAEHIGQYHRLLREQPAEISNLLHDFLISVTNFFRDPDAFEALDRIVFPKLFSGRDHSSQVRIWVPGCATGEEAYSLAILAAEHASRLDDQPQIQIFATDIDEDALAEARAGRYPAAVAADLTPARIERFFTREGSHLRVKKELRETVLFSPHNVLRDPPFSKLDLVSCRNLLIYLNRDAQDRVLGVVHFGLRADGMLFLGSSESAESAALLFAPIEGRHRIYVRRPANSTIQVASFFPSKWPSSVTPQPSVGASERSASFGELHHKVVELYAPPSILVNEDLDIVHVSEHAGRYLMMSGGEPTRDLLRLVHPALRLDLRAAIYASRQASRATDSRPVVIEVDGHARIVQITVRALDAPEVARGMLLITFAEHEGDPAAARRDGDAPEHEPVIHQLEDELLRTREQLRSTIEQYETSVEELKASNEELHAINEELRSATEELETSKEELQSVNEELTTLNHELKDKIDEVSRANSDLQNLMTSTDIGVLFLDRALNIKRYTPRAQELFNVIPSDVGRPLAHVTHRLDTEALPEQAATVLRSLRVIEQKVRSKDGRRYLLRVHPYRSVEDRIEGVVLTFLNITDLQQAEDALRGREAMLKLAERAAEAGSWELDGRTDRLRMSEECCRVFGLDPGAALALADWILRVDERDRDRVRTAVRRAADHREDLDLEFRIAHPSGGERVLWVLGRGDGEASSVAGLAIDVTARRRAEGELRVSEERFRLALRTAPVVMFSQDRELRYEWGHMQGGEIDFVGKRDEDLFDHEDAAKLTALKRGVMETGAPRREEVELTFGDRTRHYDYAIEPMRQDGTIVGVRVAAVDITASTFAERALREADRKKDEFLATLAHELRNPLTPIRTALDIQRMAGHDAARMQRLREMMDRQLGQLIHLVDDLLDVSRITRGTIQLRKERVTVGPVVEAAVESTAALFKAHGHTLAVEGADSPIVLSADPTRLTQVLTNLLTNAARYTPEPGTIRLRIEAAGGGVAFHVIDPGIGISETDLPRVFDLFHRSAAAKAAAAGGLGIGLHLVRRLVELHGGSVEARSEGPGKGSELVVRIPLGETSAPAPHAHAAPAAPRRRRILVVDDNRDVALSVTEMLEMLGHDARAVFDGLSAIAAVAAERPDVVLLDLGMPGMDGCETARRLRGMPNGQGVLLVALTGWGQQSDLERTREAGFDLHVIKPAGLPQLREIVGDGESA